MGNKYTIERAVAIDFGTTFSGFAHAEGPESEIIANPVKTEVHGRTYLYDRVPTDLMMERTEQGCLLKVFGFEARNEYFKLKQIHNRPSDVLFFEKIKHQILELHDPTDQLIKPVHGDPLMAVSAFAPALNHMRKSYMTTTGRGVSEEDIYWVISVPAQWEHNHRCFMTICAMKAKIMSSLTESNFAIVSESEAASYFCRSLKPADFEDQAAAENHAQSFHYIVVDAGGGTVDVTIVEINNTTETEYHKSTGGKFGAHSITEYFVQALFKNDQIKKCLKDSRTQSDYIGLKYWSDLIANFELAKNDFNGSNQVDVPFPRNFPEWLKQKYKITLVKLMNCASMQVDSRRKVVVLKPDFMLKCFDSVVNQIEDFLAKTLEKYDETNTTFTVMYVVGGFSKNKYLQDRLNQFCARREIRLLLPKEPGNAVAFGALRYAYSRRTTANYEAKCSFAYGSKVEQNANAYGATVARRTLKKLISKGDVIGPSSVITKSGVPYLKNEKLIIEILVGNSSSLENQSEWYLLFEFECESDTTHTINIFFTGKEVRVMLADDHKGLSTIKRIAHDTFKKRYASSGECALQ